MDKFVSKITDDIMYVCGYQALQCVCIVLYIFNVFNFNIKSK